MAETREIRSKPSRLRLQKISGGIQTVDYVTIVKGEVVDGNIFQPQGLNLQAEIDLYSKIPSQRYTTLSLTNPDLIRVDEKTGELYALSGRVINGKFILSIIATPEEQKFADSLTRLATESAVESIKTDENNYVDRSNLNPNVANTPESQGDLTSKGTQPSEKGGAATPFLYPKIKPKGQKEAYLYYPQNIADDQDKIEFSVWKYRTRDISNSETIIPSLGFRKESEEYQQVTDEPNVYLPISNKIMDSNMVNWSEDSMNELQRQLANISLITANGANSMPGPVQRPEVAASEFLEFMTTNQFGNLARTYLAGQAISVNGLLTRASGASINPNLELLFQNPQLRAFQFQFLLIGKSQQESTTIKKIIKFFKQNMAVRTKSNAGETIPSAGLTKTPAFLNSPYVFGIRYLKNIKGKNTDQGQNTDHPSINKIKKCALQNFSVDYTPMGSYMTYNDEEGSMFMYSLSMQFKELTPIYDIDYDGHPIGY